MWKYYTFDRFPAKQLPHNLLLVLLLSSFFAVSPIILGVLTYMGYLYLTQPVNFEVYSLWLKVLGLTLAWVFINMFFIWILASLGRWVLTLFIPNRDRIQPLSIYKDVRAFVSPGRGGVRNAARHRLPPNFLSLLFVNMLVGKAVIALPMVIITRLRVGIISPHNFKMGLLSMLLVALGYTLIATFIVGLGNSIGRWFFGSNEGSPADYMVSYNLDDDIENIR